MKEITNYKLINFLQQSTELQEEYLNILKFVHPLETKREVYHMKYKHVEKLKELLADSEGEGIVKAVAKVEKLDENIVLQMEIIKFFGIFNSIRKQLQNIGKAEKNALESERIEFKWEAVNGSERMSKFGLYNVLDRLTGNKPHLYKHYMNMSYSEIFTILVKRKTEDDLKYEMGLIKDVKK